MPMYRIYLLGADGHIVAPPIVAECDDDAAAVAAARDHKHQHTVEIWQSSRKVATIKPNL
jgi:hypothetical protein